MSQLVCALETLPVRIFWAFSFLCQKERKKHWVVRRARLCVLCLRTVNHFILKGRCLWVSKYHSDCVRGEICFTEIMSNTRLNLNHSSFTHLICEFFNYLQISSFIYIYSIYFLFFVYHIYLCYYLYLVRHVILFTLSQK